MRARKLFAGFSTLTVCFICACTQTPPAPEQTAAAFASSTDLVARLNEPHVDLTWKNPALAPAGYWVEFATPGSDFVKLDALWSDETQYRHPNVAPGTTYLYRIVPFFGKPSGVVSVTTGEAPAEGLDTEEEGPLPLMAVGAAPDAGKRISIRSMETLETAAPVELNARLSATTNVELRWKDRASDEDGFVVEVAANPDGPYRLCALLPPDTVSFRKILLPPRTECFFRVRAFFYGEPSKVAATATWQELNAAATAH